MSISVAERQRRAEAYLRALPPAGSGEHDRLAYQACKVGLAFDLAESEFWPLLQAWNAGTPKPRDERQLERKLQSVYRRTRNGRGRLVEEGRTANDPSPPRKYREPRYPPEHETLALWERSWTVDRVPEVGAWLRSRGIDYSQLGPYQRGVLRALPRVQSPANWPGWATIGRDNPRPWTATGFRALFPLFDAQGRLRSFKARWIEPRDPPQGMKSIPPADHDIARLFLANPVVAYMLALGRWPDQIPESDRVIHFGEGEPDYLSLIVAVLRGKRPTAGVIGYFQGSFSFDLFRRIPEGTVLIAHGQDDAAGRAYIDKLRTTFGPVLATRRIEIRQPRRAHGT